jgi:L-lactate utilization protein LutB
VSVFSEYKKEIMDAAHNERIALAISRATLSYRNNTNEALKRFPKTIELAKEVREIKKNSIANMRKLAEQACESVEYNKGKAWSAQAN